MLMYTAALLLTSIEAEEAVARTGWLSKQLKNGSSHPRASKVADRGKHAYPDSGLQAYIQESGLQVAETLLEGGPRPLTLCLGNRLRERASGQSRYT